MSGFIEAELAATCSSLGGVHGGQYVIEPQCFESVKDIIRYLRRDDEYHTVRKYLGEANILETDLVHIATTSTSEELFDIVIRLMVNLTNPVLLLYKEEMPIEKVGRNIYMNLTGYIQEYKNAFCSVPFWTVVCKKLTGLFEVDWSDRSEDYSLQIERLLVLLRNVLQVPADTEAERRPDNDVTVHDKVLWALRESQLLELLLYVSSNKDEQQYYLHLLEIFSLILREQNPGLLASCEIRCSAVEKERDAKELLVLREKEKLKTKNFKNTRTFASTFVVKNMKSISEKEIIYHRSIDSLNDLKLTQGKKRLKTPKNKFPVDSERPERRSTFSVRLFLKEFCLEILSCSFNNLMGIVKDKLVSGKGLANDESYYFWALKFFLEFTCAANVNVKHISECINVQTFHFTQTQIENCYDHLVSEKKKFDTWVKRLHLILKSYRSLLQTLQWMDASKDSKIKESSHVLKSNIFYVVEYRELLLNCLLKYDPSKYPLSFIRDLIETNHLTLKMLESFCKSNKIVVQRKKRVIKRSKQKLTRAAPQIRSPEEKWDTIKDDVFGLLSSREEFPEIPPFDATSSVAIDDQKEEAMKKIQKYLRKGEVKDGIGLLRSARQVWPENDLFGNDSMSMEDEVMAIQEICISDLGAVDEDEGHSNPQDEDDEEESDGEIHIERVEQGFDLNAYLKKLVNRKIVEGCCILLRNYKNNSANTNHCVAKLLHRIAFECKAPSMLYQASFFITLQNILKESEPEYKELKTFAKFLIKKFRANAIENQKIFMELLFWKDIKVAFDIENGYGRSEEKENRNDWLDEDEDELRRLWVEFDQKMLDGDKVDWIRDNLINQSRSRFSIIKKLKELMLIIPGTKVLKKKRGGQIWTESDVAKLAELFQKFRNASDVVAMIKERMPFSRSKKSIKDKILEVGLVDNLRDLRKKRTRSKQHCINEDISDDQTSSDSSSDNDVQAEDEGLPTSFNRNDAIVALRDVIGQHQALQWLKETYEESMEDDDEGSDGYPLLALDSHHSEALENSHFLNLLSKLNMVEPSGDQMYWKITAATKLELHERLELITAAIQGTLDELVEESFPSKSVGNNRISDGSDSEDDFEKLRRVMPAAVSIDKDRSLSENGSPENLNSPVDPFIPNVSTLSQTRVRKSRIFSNALDSDGSENELVLSEKLVRTGRRQVDSDRSDEDAASDEDVQTTPRKKCLRHTPAFSDSEGETPAPDSWRQKRRRCIGSDSEMEDHPSDVDEGVKPFEVRKRSKILDSDSDLEGQGGSMDEADILMSR